MSKRKLYYAIVEFSAPAGNVMHILAENEDHARSVLAKMHEQVKDFKIIDLHDMDENPELKKLIEMQQVPGNEEGGSTPVTVN